MRSLMARWSSAAVGSRAGAAWQGVQARTPPPARSDDLETAGWNAQKDRPGPRQRQSRRRKPGDPSRCRWLAPKGSGRRPLTADAVDLVGGVARRAPRLTRETLSTSRLTEFCSERELVALTGH